MTTKMESGAGIFCSKNDVNKVMWRYPTKMLLLLHIPISNVQSDSLGVAQEKDECCFLIAFPRVRAILEMPISFCSDGK